MTERLRTVYLPTLLLPLLMAAGIVHAGTLSLVSDQRWVTVAYVYDGDTFRTRQGEKVRLLGINTPEIAHGGSPAEPLGDRASRALHRMIQGKQLRLRFDEEKHDRYGRLLAQAWLRDGTWINGKLVEKGYAHVYTFVPNLRWAPALLKREQEARRKERGIWDHRRYRVLDADDVSRRHIGEFRLVEGRLGSISHHGWRGKMANLNISVPRKYRKWFKQTLSNYSGKSIIVHGKIRISSAGRLFLALHAPTDLEVIKP